MVTPEQPPEPRRELTVFDVTNLVIGAIIGADIYIVAALGAGLLGPALLLAWVVGAVITALVTIPFARCAVIAPRVGGAYAYTREAFGSFPGFVVGWAIYVTEWSAIAVMPIAFVLYLGYLLPKLDQLQAALVKVALIGFVIAVGLFRVKVGAAVNDILAVAKLAPLLLLIIFGLIVIATQPAGATANLVPFAPLGWEDFPRALVLVYFAYTGVELASMPAGEIKQPQRTIPRGLFLGVAIVSFFYIVVNAVVITVTPWPALADSVTPLAVTAEALFHSFGLPAALGGAIMAGGALISIGGATLATTLSTARLTYAMASDKLFPQFFARLHPRFATPYLGLAFLGSTALVAALVGGLAELITISVFSSGLVYLATALSAWRLAPPGTARYLPLPGALCGLGLMAAAAAEVGFVGIGLLLLSVPIYLTFRRRQPGTGP